MARRAFLLFREGVAAAGSGALDGAGIIVLPFATGSGFVGLLLEGIGEKLGGKAGDATGSSLRSGKPATFFAPADWLISDSVGLLEW